MMKIVLASLLLVSPIIYFLYESSEAIGRQMKKNMEQPAEVTVNENIEVLTDFSLSLSSVYTYTFVIGVSLFLLTIWKLFKDFKMKLKNYQQEFSSDSKISNAKAEAEINKSFAKNSFYDYEKRKKIRKRMK